MMEQMYNSSFNDSSLHSQDFFENFYFKLSIGICWFTLSFLGVIANGLVIYIAIKYKKLKDYTGCFIFNLALTDLLFVLFCIPFTAYIYISDYWPYGIIICKLFHFLSHVSVQSTCLTLAVMTVYRCNLIINSRKVNHNFVGVKKMRFSVIGIPLLIWLISSLVSFPDLIFYSVHYVIRDREVVGLCSLKDEVTLTHIYNTVGRPFTIIATYVIPLTIIVLSYARLISFLMVKDKNLNKSTKRIKSKKTSTSNRSEKSETIKNQVIEQTDNQIEETGLKSARTMSKEHKSYRKTRKVTTLVTVVTLNFAVCWLPAHLFIILIVFLDKRDLPNNVITVLSIFKLFAHTLSYLTPILNPIAYGFYNDSFRKPLKLLFRKRTSSAETNNQSRFSQLIPLTHHSNNRPKPSKGHSLTSTTSN